MPCGFTAAQSIIARLFLTIMRACVSRGLCAPYPRAADLKTIISDSDKLLGKMAEGDYTVSSDMEDKYTGDFIGLLMAMRQMKTQMNDVMSHINEISSLVTAGSNNLAQAAQEIC